MSQQKYNRLQSNRNDSSIANRYLRADSRPECIMSWRIVVISKRAKLDYQLGYLVVRNEEVTKIHLSEISTILIESTAATVTTSLLAELTKTDVITDFRSRDLAAGGEGAPLVPAFHKWVLSGDVPRGILNIGGISNLTVLPERGSDDEVLGFDCGPGNVLMDAWIEKVNHVRYDRDAMWARSGKVIPQLLESLKQEKFFSQVPPKSTGRELFNLPWLEARLNGEKPEDVQRTLVSFTAETVTDAIRNFAPHIKELRVCGGGAKNPLMISELALLNPDLLVTTTADLGVDPQDVEGLAFAWLAYRFDRRETGNLPSATGASGSRILGCLYPA